MRTIYISRQRHHHRQWTWIVDLAKKTKMSGLKFGRGAPHGYVRLPSRLCPHCFQTQPARCHTPACYWIVLREKVLAQKKMEEAKLPKSRNNKHRRNTKKLLKMAHEFPLLYYHAERNCSKAQVPNRYRETGNTGITTNNKRCRWNGAQGTSIRTVWVIIKK